MLIAAVAALAVLAGIAALTFGHLGSSDAAQRKHDSLSTKITGEQAVGLANLGQTGQAGSANSAASLLYASAGGLIFTPGSGRENVEPSQQWQADEMGGGQFVLLFTQDGLCLTAVGSGSQASAQLDRCDSGLDQRWAHPFEGTDGLGRDYWQLRSAADGECLALGAADSEGDSVAVLQRCSATKPWQQLVTFWSAF